MKNLHETITAGVREILGENGMIVRGGMSYSPIQYAYAMRIAEGLTRDEVPDDHRTRINMLEAQTGTGKTLGYLVPLMLYAAHTGGRILVSTYTRMLQKQILDKDAAIAQGWVAKLTGRHLVVRRRLGRGNYVSPSRCAQLIVDLEEHATKGKGGTDIHDAIDTLHRLLEWLDARDSRGEPLNSGVLDDFLDDYGLDDLPAGASRAQVMLRAEDPEEEAANYRRDVEASKGADIAVVNHALLVMHAYRWGQVLDEKGEEGREAVACVVDEADRLPDAAAAIIGADLSLHTMTAIAQEVGASHPEAANAASALAALHDAVQAMQKLGYNAMAITSSDTESRTLVEKVAHANNAVRSVAASLSQRLQASLLDPDPHPNEAIVRFVDMANDLSNFADAMRDHDNTAVVSWSPIRRYPSLRIGKPNPGRILARLWWAGNGNGNGNLPEVPPLHAILFTSATLSVPGKPLPVAFDPFANSVGASRFLLTPKGEPVNRLQTDLFAQFEPTRYGAMSFVLADPRVPNPTAREEDEQQNRAWTVQPEWLDYAAHMVETAWRTGGRVLALTNSHRDTASIAQRLLAGPAADDLIVHLEGEPLAALRRAYIERERAIMITAAGWEGLDMPGMVPNLVITRIPFPPFDNPEIEILKAHLFARGMSQDKIDTVLKANYTQEARRKLAQGIGRGIRSKTDKTCVWIADPRFPLPEPMTQSLDPVIMGAQQRSIQHQMLSCIPSRFRDDVFAQAQLLLRDGGLYRPQ